MSFPLNPADGATHTVGTTNFTYNLETNQWMGAVALSGGSGSSGGGSMAAPTHYGKFTMTAYFGESLHIGGTVSNHTLNQNLTIDSVLPLGANGQVIVDPANYGTAITLGGAAQDFSGMPQFCSDADYLASNPTWVGPPGNLVNGQYYCAETNLVRYTQDSGATFNTYAPQIQPDGTINLAIAGKYKIKIEHMCIIGGVSPYQYPNVHTVILIDNVIRTNHVARASWELDANNQVSAKCVLRTEFDTIIETTAADTKFTIALSKLGTNANTTSNSLYVVTVESLF